MQNLIRHFYYGNEEKAILPARREAFTALSEWLSSIAEELNLVPRLRKQLLIACDEIFTNICSYAYEKEGTVTVSAAYHVLPQKLEIVFSDNGVAFDPLAQPEADVKARVVNGQCGGLGLFMVKKMMDSVEYKRENNSNILILTKKVESSAG